MMFVSTSCLTSYFLLLVMITLVCSNGVVERDKRAKTQRKQGIDALCDITEA